MGDTVAIEIEQMKKAPDAVHYPFKVSWAPAEIISIYRVHKSKESCLKLRQGLAVSEDQDDKPVDVVNESRWLYRPWEVPGSNKSNRCHEGTLNEVFETDQVDVCSAESVLSPVQLCDLNRFDVGRPNSVGGMPLIYYYCYRLWSVHRRTFVPSGSLNNRVSRG